YAEGDQKPDAADYIPRPQYRAVPAVEGTALMLSRECWQDTGGMDLRAFGPYGWGVDLDLALRARQAGYGVYTTEMAYINHFGHKTGSTNFGRWGYLLRGNLAMVQGLRRLHGWGATMAMMWAFTIADLREWPQQFPLDRTTHQLRTDSVQL